MYIYTRRNPVANRVGAIKIILVAACLLLSKGAFAQSAPSHAEHEYLVSRCVERAAAGSSDPSYAAATARCEQLQRQIDAVFGPFQLGQTSRNYEEPCVRGLVECKTDASPGGSAVHGTAVDMSSARAGFTHAFDRSGSGKDCVGIACITEVPPMYLATLDRNELQRQFRNQTVNGSDHIADLIHPGFGRWERKNQDMDMRLDFLNPRRCGGYQKVGICFSVIMH